MLTRVLQWPWTRRRHAPLLHALERLLMTAADLTAAVAALTEAVANLPTPVPALITQAELDASTQGVQDATAAIVAKTV